jgi:Concanavalin A-like lectin/glucanases superfamily
VEAWFSTTSQFGGELAGMGTAATGLSTTTDRVLYLTNEGRVAFGAGAAAPAGISSRLTYNDGRWHHAVATLGASGAVLYIDGVQVAANASLQPTSFIGYWRVGGDRLAAWPGVALTTPVGRGFPWPTHNSLTGGLDDVAVYPGQLSAVQVLTHYLRGAPEAGTMPSLSGATIRLSPTDDATVSALNAATSYGTAKTLTVDVDQAMQDFLLGFSVPSGCTPATAALTLTVGAGSTNASVYGGDLYAAPDNGWAEASVTYGTAPARTGSPVSLNFPVTSSTAYTLDVTPLLAAGLTGSRVSLRMTTPSKDAAAYVSRNAPAAVPLLAITCG